MKYSVYIVSRVLRSAISLSLIHILNVQDGEDITVKLNTLLAQARDRATDEKQCKVIVPPGNYTLTGTLHMYSNIYLYAEMCIRDRNRGVESGDDFSVYEIVMLY